MVALSGSCAFCTLHPLLAACQDVASLFYVVLCVSEELIFHMEDTGATSTRGVASSGRPLSSGTLLTDEKKSGVS